MSLSVERRGIPDVLSGFEMHTKDSPMYSLWQANILKFAFCSQDSEEAVNTLNQNLQAIAASESVAIYTLRFHKELDKDGYIGSKTPYFASFNFKLPGNSGGYVDPGTGLPAKFVSVPNQVLLERLDAMQKRLDELEFSEPVAENNLMSGIGLIMEQPWAQTLLTNVMNGIFNKQPGQVVNPMAGVPGSEEDKINSALEVLKQHDDKLGDHLLVLANMAINTPTKFKMLLAML